MHIEENIRKSNTSTAVLGPAPTDAFFLVSNLCSDLYAFTSASAQKNHASGLSVMVVSPGGIAAATNSRMTTRTALAQIYNHALNVRFYEARDLLLMSHLQESIGGADISTQVLYNRTMAQVGIAAFRCGAVKECCFALNVSLKYSV